MAPEPGAVCPTVPGRAPAAPFPQGPPSSAPPPGWKASSQVRGVPPAPAVTPRPVPVPRGAAGEPSRGQAPAQGCPPRPLCSTPAGPAATSGAAAAQVAPAAGAAAIFVGPAATGFSVAHGACAAVLRPSACVLSACATPPSDTMATQPTLGPTVPSLAQHRLYTVTADHVSEVQVSSPHSVAHRVWVYSRSLAPRFAAQMLPRELQGGLSREGASPQGGAGWPAVSSHQ